MGWRRGGLKEGEFETGGEDRQTESEFILPVGQQTEADLIEMCPLL